MSLNKQPKMLKYKHYRISISSIDHYIPDLNNCDVDFYDAKNQRIKSWSLTSTEERDKVIKLLDNYFGIIDIENYEFK